MATKKLLRIIMLMLFDILLVILIIIIGFNYYNTKPVVDDFSETAPTWLENAQSKEVSGSDNEPFEEGTYFAETQTESTEHETAESEIETITNLEESKEDIRSISSPPPLEKTEEKESIKNISSPPPY